MYGHVYMQLRPPQIVNACAVLPLSFTVTFASPSRDWIMALYSRWATKAFYILPDRLDESRRQGNTGEP
jgi:hypothetical protein